jgi:aminocarboxymuconate-semialdehyde decarboxylase
MIPFFYGRVQAMYTVFEPLLAEERGRPLQRPVLDYFRSFYTDVSTFTSSSVECAAEFFGVDHVLYGTDAPFDIEGGRFSIREATAAIEKSSLKSADKQKIYSKNFETLFRQTAAAAARA